MTRPTPKQLAAARALLSADRRARAAEREPRVTHKPAKPAPADDGSDYMAWLHHGLPCIACLVVGRHALAPAPIEAAHQKLQVAERGWHRRAGRRGPHWTCAPLCAGHHRIGPLCCDPAQTKFWGVLGLEPPEVIDFVEALNVAFREDRPGLAIVHQFARQAAENRTRSAA